MSNPFTTKDPLLDVISQIVGVKEEVDLDEAKGSTHEDPLITVHKDGRLHAHLHLSTANYLHKTDVKHTQIHAGPVKVKTKYGDNLEFKLSKWHDVKEDVEQIDEGMGKLDLAQWSKIHRDHTTFGRGSQESADRINKIEAHVKKKYGKDAHTKMVDDSRRYASGTSHGTEGKPKSANEEVEQIDEISDKTLARYVDKAVVDVHNDAKWSGESGDRKSGNKAFKRVLGIKSAASRLGKTGLPHGGIHQYRSYKEEVKYSGRGAEAEQLKHQGYPDSSVHAAWSDYHLGQARKYLNKNPKKHQEHLQQHLSHLEKMNNSAKKEMAMKKEEVDFSSLEINESQTQLDAKQNVLLRAMAKDPAEIVKMRRALGAGDKALGNPMMRAEILKMLDQMMDLTTSDPALLQRTKAGLMKSKRLPEEVEQVDEVSKKTLGSYVKKANTEVMHRAHAQSTADAYSRPDIARDHGDRKWKRMRGIVKATDKLTKEETESLDEISKKTLGSYVKKAMKDGVNKAVLYSHDAAKVSSKAPPTRTDSDYDKLRAGERGMAKRSKGIDLAVKKLTKEEADKGAPFDGGREVKSKKSAAERVKKIAKGMEKKYTKEDFVEEGYTPSSEKSKFSDGHRAKLMNPNGGVSYLSQKAYKTPEHAKAAAAHYQHVMHKPSREIDSHMSKYESEYDRNNK